MLTVTAAAETLQLLTAEQMRIAAGLASNDTSQDSVLTPLGLRVAEEIANECGVVPATGHPPTLLKERLTETIRGVEGECVILSRRHNVSLVSATLDGDAVTLSTLEADPEEGVVRLLSGESYIEWQADKLVVVYDAGFTTVPADLVGAATDLFRIRRSQTSRDPLQRAATIEVPDVLTERYDYWVGALPGNGASAGIPADIASRLARYRNGSVG